MIGDLPDLRPLQIARLEIVHRELSRCGRVFIRYDADAEHAWASCGLTLEQRDEAVDFMAEIGTVRLRPTAAGVLAELARKEGGS